VLPNVPALAELGFPELRGLDINSWVGLVAPAKTPQPIVGRLEAALRQTLASEDVHTRLVNAGAVPVKSSPEIFAGQIAADLERWKKLIVESRLRLEA
jgi:tripartite-type tricarboxylate transporter receptor subunit TctC